MAKERLVINGFKVPNGWSGVAVRRACETVSANPGITQKDLLEEAIRFSGLNLSTSGWITSPGPKSPATVLWDRRKDGVFRCYPNEHTEKVVGSAEAAVREIISEFQGQIARAPDRGVKIGDLVRFEMISPYHEYPPERGIVIGYMLGGSKIFNRLEDISPSDCTGRAALRWAVLPTGQSQPCLLYTSNAADE